MAINQINPASKRLASAGERKRIPMGVPVQKLEVADIPGYHLHWFLGTPERIARAQEGGYEFVKPEDAQPNNVSLGGDSAVSGSTDMGSQVSIVAGSETGRDGQPVRMVLMKIKLEWYEEDQKVVENRNDLVRDSLLGGMIGADKDAPGDSQHRYVDKARTAIPDLFKRKRPRGAP